MMITTRSAWIGGQLVTRAQAFEVFGLPESATDGEVRARFRALARERHPDAGGSSADWLELMEAAGTVLADPQPVGAMVPLDQVKDLVLAATLPLTEQLEQNERRESLRRVIENRTSPIRSARTTQIWLTAVSAVLAAGAAYLHSQTPALKAPAVAYASGALALFAFLFAILIAISTARISFMESAIADVTAELESPDTISEVLLEAIHKTETGGGTIEGTPTEWAEAELSRCLHVWLQDEASYSSSLGRMLGLPVRPAGFRGEASLMGGREFSRFVIKNATSMKILSTRKSWQGGRHVTFYSYTSEDSPG